MKMEKAVCDTSTLIRLCKGEVLYCLNSLFEKVYLPPAVQSECRDDNSSRMIQKPPFEIYPVQNIRPFGMGRGEREALSLALELGIKIIMIDDKRAFNKARQLDLEPLRTQDLLVFAKHNGIIPSVKAVLETMRANNEHIPDEIYWNIILRAGEV